MSSCKPLPSAWCYRESWFPREIEMTFGLVLESLFKKGGDEKNGTSDQMLNFPSGSAEPEGVVPEYASEMQRINRPKENFYGHTTFIFNQ